MSHQTHEILQRKDSNRTADSPKILDGLMASMSVGNSQSRPQPQRLDSLSEGTSGDLSNRGMNRPQDLMARNDSKKVHKPSKYPPAVPDKDLSPDIFQDSVGDARYSADYQARDYNASAPNPGFGFRGPRSDEAGIFKESLGRQARSQQSPFEASERYQGPLSPERYDSAPLQICLECRKDILDVSEAFEIESMGGWFHAKCFRCLDCGCSFGDDRPFVPHEGEVYCERDYQAKFGGDICGACSKPITDGKVSHAFGLLFHPRHLRCHICKHRIRGPHVEHNGKAFCQEDYQRLISSSCNRCKQEIGEDGIHACGVVWHRQCFGCTACSRPFPDKKFYTFDGQPYCLEHYHQATNSICRGCQRPISGACVEMQDVKGPARFHTGCFACGGCGNVLNGVYYTYRGVNYCERDIEGFTGGDGRRPEKRHTLMRGGLQ